MAQEIAQVITDWMAAQNVHGKVTKCESLRRSAYPNQIRHCGTCEREWGDPLHTWKLTKKMNSYPGEEDIDGT